MDQPQTKQQQPKPKLKRKARNPESYRATRRNEARANYRARRPAERRLIAELMVRIGAKPKDGSFSGSIELNRSQDWSRAQTYAYAREISPYPERTLR